ncbi:uncharacterized protein LOC136714279 [Amia ocellicauda]|uniref:uncharacterized protein LOC136714279 n=1 Tax=Amia ocellicauda TaxID=2972642 RepID=UPI003463EDB7
MPCAHNAVISVGVVLMVAGVLMFTCLNTPSGILPSVVGMFGLPLGLFGTILMVFGMYMAMKARNVATTGYFSHHIGNCTRFHDNQSDIIQRRLERMRSLVSDNRERAPPPPRHSQYSVSGLPPLWDLDPPPSYEMVMKSTMRSSDL